MDEFFHGFTLIERELKSATVEIMKNHDYNFEKNRVRLDHKIEIVEKKCLDNIYKVNYLKGEFGLFDNPMAVDLVKKINNLRQVRNHFHIRDDCNNLYNSGQNLEKNPSYFNTFGLYHIQKTFGVDDTDLNGDD